MFIYNNKPNYLWKTPNVRYMMQVRDRTQQRSICGSGNNINLYIILYFFSFVRKSVLILYSYLLLAVNSETINRHFILNCQNEFFQSPELLLFGWYQEEHLFGIFSYFYHSCAGADSISLSMLQFC